MSQRALLDLAEIERSAKEAARVTVVPPNRGQVERYLNPRCDTPFPLEYAFSLLGDLRGKTVLDLGCGSGENIIPLAARGACVLALDISPDLVALAQQRVALAGLETSVQVGSAYETGLPDHSVDIIFCIALIHHLDIGRVRNEMQRILTARGQIILKEPIRFSQSYARLRNLLPAPEDASEYEHPLTKDEFAALTGPFDVDGTRYFRLPFVPAFSQFIDVRRLVQIDQWCLRRLPAASHYATCIVTRLSGKALEVRTAAG
jgi:SAM-dependent methyltransferase